MEPPSLADVSTEECLVTTVVKSGDTVLSEVNGSYIFDSIYDWVEIEASLPTSCGGEVVALHQVIDRNHTDLSYECI